MPLHCLSFTYLLLLGLLVVASNSKGASANNLAPAATLTTSYVSDWENLFAITNGINPASSTDKTGGAYGNWPQTGTNWVEYYWPSTTYPLGVKLDQVAVYWWTDNGGIMAPSACWLDYWNGSNYVSVPNAFPGGFGVALNKYNITTFGPVTTDRVRLRFRAGTASTGILEWKAFGDKVELTPLTLSGRSVTPGVLTVGWPASSSEYFLEASGLVASETEWTTNGLPPTTSVGGSNYINVPMSETAAYFRLHSRNDFAMQLDAPSLVVTQGLANSLNVQISASGIFKQAVILSATNLPIGVTADFNPPTLQNGESIMTLIAQSGVTASSFPVTVVGQGALSSHAASLTLTVAAEAQSKPYVWPKYNPDLNYNFTNEFASIPTPTNVLNDCSGVSTTITLPDNWFCFRFGSPLNPNVTSNSWIPMLQRLDSDFRYFRDVMGWPPDKRAKRGYKSAVYLLGSGTCVGGDEWQTGGWMGSINYNGEDWPIGLFSYYPVWSFDPAYPNGDAGFQQGACTHELIHSVLADMPGCKKAAWFQEGGNTWLQGEAEARKSGNYSGMGWLSAGSMLAPFMPIECYTGWLQDDSFGGPSAEGVNMFSNTTQICTWRTMLGGVQYSEAFPHFMGEIVSPGSVAWIWRYCTNRVLEGLGTAPEGLGNHQTRRLIMEYRARQVMCDFGKWSNAYKALLNNNWGQSWGPEWQPYWINCAPWTARCYVVTTNNSGILTPERRTLPGWSGANQIPLTALSSVGNVTVNFTPFGTNMSCQLVYRATDNTVIYSKPVASGTCTLTPPVGKAIKNNVVVAVICNTDYIYNGESSRTNKFDYRLQITGAGTYGVAAAASIASKWYQ